MNPKYLLHGLRRRTLSLVFVLALAAALLPTAAFASGGSYGHQGRAYNPGPRPQQYHQGNNNHSNNNYGNNNHSNNNQSNNQGHGYNNNNNNQNYHPNNNNHNQNNNQPSQCSTTYKVRHGDTLSGIAAYFGVSVSQLQHENGIHNANQIYAGQVLCIPC